MGEGDTVLKKIGYAATVGEESIYKTIDFASENCMSAVEINLNVPIYFPENFSMEERNKIKEYANSKGITISMHAPEDITLLQLQKGIRKATLKRLKEIIDFGIHIGGRALTLHVGPSVCFTLVDRKSYMEEFYKEDYKKILKDSLIELLNHASNKLSICIENSGRFTENLIQETLQELLDTTSLSLTWDIGHSYENKYNEVEFFTQNIDRVKTCHVHDNNGSSDHQIPGSGGVDFKNIFNLMKNKDIVYIIEVRPREQAVKSFKKLQEQFFRE